MTLSSTILTGVMCMLYLSSAALNIAMSRKARLERKKYSDLIDQFNREQYPERRIFKELDDS